MAKADGGTSGVTPLELTLPACYSVDTVVDRNRSRQLLVPSQTVQVIATDANIPLKVRSKQRLRLLRRRGLLRKNELALLVPAAVELADGLDLATSPGVAWIGDRSANPTAVLPSLKDAFAFIEDDPPNDKTGLRKPQIGALHAVLGYWTTDPVDPATVVMPTGTGKTETMLSLLARQRPDRLLVLVPSDTLRTQIAGKFETFGVLPALGVVSHTALPPVVGQVRHRFSSPDSAREFAEQCNVLISTPQALMSSSSEIREAIAACCSHLFIDEAHHLGADTWRAIRELFSGKPVVQFTATPFREDGRRLGGRLLYAFPLREAQRQGYFSHINYISVVEFENPDAVIAAKALEILRTDLDAGRDHLLMARVKRIGRATEVLPIYQELAPDLNPVVVHSSTTVGARQAALEAIRSRDSRVVGCVDMLGEGFDLPALKVAAIHDPHKSIGVTLQFVGRFTRVSDTSIGEATVVVGRPELDYDDQLRRLYAEDADWDHLIRDLSEKAVGAEQEVTEFEAGFGAVPDEVSLHNLLPKMSTVVYRTAVADWTPEAVVDHYPEERVFTSPSINTEERVAWFVLENHSQVRWGNLRTIEEIGYDLYVLYWDHTRQLLYINSSNTDSEHEDLAAAVCGVEVDRIRGETIYRVMAQVVRLVPTNVGVLDFRNRARRFSMHVGADVTEGFPTAEAQTKTKTNIFAYGFEDGTRVSVGASLKGRVWSYRVAMSLKHWVDWCDYIGNKLVDDSISVDEIMRDFIRPQVVEARPELVAIALEWPWEIFLSTSEEVRVEHVGSSWPIVDADLRIRSVSNSGPIEFSLVTPDWGLDYQAILGDGSATYQPVGPDANVVTRRTSVPLSTYLSNHGLTFHFEQDTTIEHGFLLKPPRELPPFDRERIEDIDWTGINLRKESQGATRDADSIQARAFEHLETLADWDVVIDDDGCGEIADLVAIKVTNDEFVVHLVHCKFSSEDTPGARLADLYEVCGQAQKSGRWRRNLDHMLRHLIRREKTRLERAGRTGMLKGQPNKLYEVQDRARLVRPRFSVSIAQPGLSKARISDQQLELLAATEVYLSESATAELTVYSSA